MEANSNVPFDLDAFIAGINSDKTQPKSSKDRLNRVLMNTRTNQGTLTFLPVFSKTARNFYMKLNRVYEYYGETSLIENGEAWFRILPLDMYGELTQEQMDLYHEVKSYLDTLNDNEEVSYNEFRVRNYSLLYGIGMSLTNTDKQKVEDVVDTPCLFVYPSAKVIDSLCDAINNKIDVMGGKKEWLTYVLTPANTGRKGVLQISFVKSSGAGYDTSVAFEFNSELNVVVDPSYTIPDESIEKFDDVLPAFLGWIYDSANKSYFRTEAFKELRDQLKLRIKTMEGGEPHPADVERTYENKNDLTPSGATPTESAAPAASPRRPF